MISNTAHLHKRTTHSCRSSKQQVPTLLAGGPQLEAGPLRISPLLRRCRPHALHSMPWLAVLRQRGVSVAPQLVHLWGRISMCQAELTQQVVLANGRVHAGTQQ